MDFFLGLLNYALLYAGLWAKLLIFIWYRREPKKIIALKAIDTFELLLEIR